jgi:hypothetical protein
MEALDALERIARRFLIHKKPLTIKAGSGNQLHFGAGAVVQVKATEERLSITNMRCEMVYVGMSTVVRPRHNADSEVAIRAGNINYELKHIMGSLLKLRGRLDEDDRIFKHQWRPDELGEFSETDLDDIESFFCGAKLEVRVFEYPQTSEADVYRQLRAYSHISLLNKTPGTLAPRHILYVISLCRPEVTTSVRLEITLGPCFVHTSFSLYAQLVKCGCEIYHQLHPGALHVGHDETAVQKPTQMLMDEVGKLLEGLCSVAREAGLSQDRLVELLKEEISRNAE